MENKFQNIYDNNEWGNGSGAGSRIKSVKKYMSFLEGFIQMNNVTSVVDAGCGDWQFSKNINWGQVSYKGFDIVNTVVENNLKNFSDKNISFEIYNGDPDNLPSADLLILKDVLQHLPHRDIYNFVNNFGRYKYCLITNCINPQGQTINLDISRGDFTFLDLRLEPFMLNAREVFSFENHIPFYKLSFFTKPKWIKKTILIENNN
jgi:SAM-dependent methyltransferase